MGIPSLGKNNFWEPQTTPRHCREGAGSDKSRGVAEEGVHIQATLPDIRENASAVAPGLAGGDLRHWWGAHKGDKGGQPGDRCHHPATYMLSAGTERAARGVGMPGHQESP